MRCRHFGSCRIAVYVHRCANVSVPHEPPFALPSDTHVLDYYFGLTATDWIVAFKTAKDQQLKDAADTEQPQCKERNTNSHPSLPLEKYAGSYEDAWYGPATIRTENGKLVLSFEHTPAMVGELKPWQYDTFRTHWRDRIIADPFVTFSLKADGSIERFKMAPSPR